MALRWLSRVLSPRRVSKRVVTRPAIVAAPKPALAVVVDADDGPQPFLPWIAGLPSLTDAALSQDEQYALAELEKLLALPAVPDNMLPRAAELVPQMIALLRETQLPLQAIAERVSKDDMLAAEVMRLASSPYYRAQGDVVDIVQAIRLIGSLGLQTVIARVILKPIYRGAPNPISADVALRLWEHSEALAQHMAVQAELAGQAAFDGYLAGMLHNTGWKVALCAIERSGIALAMQPSAAFALVLTERVHRLFGLAAQRWSISPGFVAFANDARRNGLVGATHPMAAVLREAQRHCMAEVLQRT